MTASYRDSHAGDGHGVHYDETLYRADRYDAVVWRMEQAILERWLKRYFPDGIHSHLDFACGTGRITSKMAGHAQTSVGVDVSAAMLEEARKKLPQVKFYHGDITRDRSLLGGDDAFNCITMFRFLLNAEPPLREDALKALLPLLADDGFLICNNHGSDTGLLRTVICIRKLLRLPVQQTLSYEETTKLFVRCGWELVEMKGVCFLPRGLSRIFPAFIWSNLDRLLGRIDALKRFGIYQMYLLKKAAL